MIEDLQYRITPASGGWVEIPTPGEAWKMSVEAQAYLRGIKPVRVAKTTAFDKTSDEYRVWHGDKCARTALKWGVKAVAYTWLGLNCGLDIAVIIIGGYEAMRFLLPDNKPIQLRLVPASKVQKKAPSCPNTSTPR